jgi:DNA recombination protein RmuC
MLTNILLITVCLLLLTSIGLLLRKKEDPKSAEILKEIQSFQKELSRIESAVREEVRINRQELGQSLIAFQSGFNDSLKTNREELSGNLKEFRENMVLQLDKINNRVEEKLKELNQNNEKKLEEMRHTVDEKLQKTLNERLGQSFEMVNKQLADVQKGLGEMQVLAQDVGGLKRVLSNVKMRGGLGEVRLEMLLEQILAPDQYEANVKTKKGSSDLVEFAIRLPGKDDDGGIVYLPIDAKFPQDQYHHLLDAYDHADPDGIESATKQLEATLKKMAKDIRDKYLDPPNTTEFGIMFLPFEGIYAEVVRRSSLVETLQKDFHVIITGPTTLAAILNSLQMGFKTLAIQKRSSEVWKVLGAVKSEFEKFGGLLDKAQKNLHTASSQLDELVGKRTKAIQRKLREVESLPAPETAGILPEAEEETEDEEGL